MDFSSQFMMKNIGYTHTMWTLAVIFRLLLYSDMTTDIQMSKIAPIANNRASVQSIINRGPTVPESHKMICCYFLTPIE